jgi:hypothetical protein
LPLTPPPPPAPFTSAGAGALPPDLMARMSDPAMMEQMLGVLQGMDEEALAQMLTGMGAPGGEATARKVAHQLKSMSPGQVRAMARLASVGQKGAALLQDVRERLAGKGMLVAAVVVLVVAVLLRWLGWM